MISTSAALIQDLKPSIDPLLKSEKNLADIVLHCEDLLKSGSTLRPEEDLTNVTSYASQGLTALAYQVLEASKQLQAALNAISAAVESVELESETTEQNHQTPEVIQPTGPST
ncbi:hypothetical protein HDV05_008810 [Chytridiales sp. JEL 0842]|nr:hypothetical protein HDV05_008810 [Chytridiales sp. JEL 0842]